MDKKIKVIIDDVEMEVLVSEEELAKLTKKRKKTGYERVNRSEKYYTVTGDCNVRFDNEEGYVVDNNYYASANYYSDQTVAKTNARAEKLMRQLRRFAAENCEEINWKDNSIYKYYIYYDYERKNFYINEYRSVRDFGQIYFDTEENAQKALDIFKDELTWYFTDYRDRV